MHFLCRIVNWIKRFRHRCGYGVHSPSDFFLITSVVYESLPYYAYRSLEAWKFPAHLPHYRRKVNRLLFRLVNHFQPEELVEVGPGNGASMGYLQAARPSMHASVIDGSTRQQTLAALKGMGRIDFLHIGFTPYYKEVFEAAFPHLTAASCVVVGGIYGSREKREWWKQLTADERVRISFDLYDIGILLFEAKRFKQNYIVNFL